MLPQSQYCIFCVLRSLDGVLAMRSHRPFFRWCPSDACDMHFARMRLMHPLCVENIIKCALSVYSSEVECTSEAKYEFPSIWAQLERKFVLECVFLGVGWETKCSKERLIGFRNTGTRWKRMKQCVVRRWTPFWGGWYNDVSSDMMVEKMAHHKNVTFLWRLVRTVSASCEVDFQ